MLWVPPFPDTDPLPSHQNDILNRINRATFAKRCLVPHAASTASKPTNTTAVAITTHDAITCQPVAEATTRKRDQKASDVSHLVYVAKRQSVKNPKVSQEEICEGWSNHVKSVVDMPFCKNFNGRTSKCQCLQFLRDTDELLDPIVNYMTKWSSCTEQQQDQTLLNEFLYTSRTEEKFGNGCHYQIPYDMTAQGCRRWMQKI